MNSETLPSNVEKFVPNDPTLPTYQWVFKSTGTTILFNYKDDPLYTWDEVYGVQRGHFEAAPTVGLTQLQMFNAPIDDLKKAVAEWEAALEGADDRIVAYFDGRERQPDFVKSKRPWLPAVYTHDHEGKLIEPEWVMIPPEAHPLVMELLMAEVKDKEDQD